MKFYSRFPGDITIKTGDLTLTEFGAYDRLLDHYYAKEAPIDPTRVYSVCRAMGKQDREAVDRVLAEFWTLTEDGWVQGRADEVIARARPRIEAAKKNGKLGGRPRKNPTGKPSGFSGETQSEPGAKAIHTPVSTGGSSSDEEPPPDVGFAPTPAAAVCIALKAAGIANVNPSHATLRTLVEAGADVAEFIAAVKSSEGKGDRFAYVIGTVEGQRKRAAATAGVIHHGPLHAVSKQAAAEAVGKQAAREWLAQES